MEFLKEATNFVTALGILLVAILQVWSRVTMKSMAKDLRTVELATNSMKDQLVAKTESEALARGGIEERARADIRDKKERGET